MPKLECDNCNLDQLFNESRSHQNSLNFLGIQDISVNRWLMSKGLSLLSNAEAKKIATMVKQDLLMSIQL